MADKEIQVFEGDGVVPPEVKALVEENESLRKTIAKLHGEEKYLNQIIDRQAADLEHYAKQLKAISKIIATPMPDDEPDIDCDGMLIDREQPPMMAKDYLDQIEQAKKDSYLA